MNFLSFAPNFEDVLLWRALKDVAGGFYIDAAATDPDEGSVTRAFYDRGWRGVNVAESPESYTRLLAGRPRDVTLPPGLHSLAEIVRDAAPGDVHFLRGAPGLLRDADFSVHRPWIILVAAPQPEGEPALRAAGYRFAWFDGLSRFYLADERHAALAHAFATPPNRLDDFVRATDTGLAARLAVAQAEAAFDQARAHHATQRLLDAVRIAGQVRTREAGHVESIGWLRDLLQEAREAADRLRAEAAWRRELLETEQRLTGDQAAQLAARAEQVAWLEGILATRDAALAAALAAAALEHAALDSKRAAQEERADAAEARGAGGGGRGAGASCGAGRTRGERKGQRGAGRLGPGAREPVLAHHAAAALHAGQGGRPARAAAQPATA